MSRKIAIAIDPKESKKANGHSGRRKLIRAKAEVDSPACEKKSGAGGLRCRVNEVFHRVSAIVAGVVGSPVCFVLSVAVVVVWAALGPHYHYNDTWQLVINTGTTIVTFLMVFLIQNTQNRDSRAIHLKLDELLRGTHGAKTSMVDLEHATDEELEALEKKFEHIRKQRAGKD